MEMSNIIMSGDQSVNAANTPTAINQPMVDMSVFSVQPGQDQNVQNGATDQPEVNQNPYANLQIDERYKNLDPKEAAFRTIQSKYDTLQNTHNQINEQYTKQQQYVQFLYELLEDDQTLEAFLHERKPELAQNIADPTTRIRTELAKEFGEDFQPDPSEANIAFSKTWLYNRKVDQLFQKYQTESATKPTTIKALREERARAKAEEERKVTEQLQGIRQKYNVNDQTMQYFQDWAKGLTVGNLWDMFNYALRKAPQNVPGSVAMVHGSPTSDYIQSRIDQLF